MIKTTSERFEGDYGDFQGIEGSQEYEDDERRVQSLRDSQLSGPVRNSKMPEKEAARAFENKKKELFSTYLKKPPKKSSEQNPLYYNFTSMHNALSSRVLLPEKYVYIKGKQDPGKERISEMKIKPRELAQNEEEIQNPFLKQMQKCISSGTDFRENNLSFIETLLYEPNQGNFYLTQTFQILNSTGYSPSSKFYTLYLLQKVTEVAENTFIAALAKPQ